METMKLLLPEKVNWHFDEPLYPEGCPRCGFHKFTPILIIGHVLLLYGIVGALFVPLVGPQPDRHERLLPLWVVDRLRPGRHRPGRRRLFQPVF